MFERGKSIVELVLRNELKKCHKKRPTETLEKQNSFASLSENGQKSADNEEHNDEDNPGLLLLNTALSQDRPFANEIAEYGMDHNDDCVNTDVIPPDTTIQSNNNSLEIPENIVDNSENIHYNLEAESEDEEAEAEGPNWSPDEEENSNSEPENDSDQEPHDRDVPNFLQSEKDVTNFVESTEDNIENKRKRQCDPNKWKRNERKRKRNRGEKYVSSRQKNVSDRIMLKPCKQSCKFKCSEKIDENNRLYLFKKFWDLGNLQNQRNYILHCLTCIPSTTSPSNNKLYKRQSNHAFYFNLQEVKIRVCKVFFVNTLGISDRVIRTVIKKTKDGFLEAEKRGKHTHHRTVDASIKQGVIDHIASIPRIESHYLRAQTTREYIDGGRTLADIHRDYKNICKTEGRQFANYTMFSRIFRSEFNISFFTPKKDQCGICEQYNNSNEEEKGILRDTYDKHTKEKELSRLEKEEDKQQAKTNNCVAACFDLQAVLQTPCGDINSFYYKSKLSTYNFTIFDLGSLQGHCYIWHEGEGNRGANEIGTCLYKFLESRANNVPIVLYSDNCCGQNKNKFITCLLLYAVRTLNIPSIELKFLVVGHTQNEGDNMHSLIEKQKKRSLKSGPVYIPAQWIPIIGNAKKSGKPFDVNEMDYTDFNDLKTLQESMGNNFSLNANGEKVVWHDIAMLKVSKTQSSSVYYKNSYDDNYKQIFIRKTVRASSTETQTLLQPAYSTNIKVSQTKIDALSELCTKNHIKKKYHAFYESLGCTVQPVNEKSKLKKNNEDLSMSRKKKN